MIPAKIVRFLDERANIGFAGTRDASLVPRGHRVCGWQIAADGRVLTAFVPAVSAEPMVATLQENGRIAITLEEVGTHETYQIKGRYLNHRPVRPSEVEIANRARERFVKGLRALFLEDHLLAAMQMSIPAPSLAVEIVVEEVFLQTPGPGAGTRLAPLPEAEAHVR
jgi:hypothetical protein